MRLQIGFIWILMLMLHVETISGNEDENRQDFDDDMIQQAETEITENDMPHRRFWEKIFPFVQRDVSIPTFTDEQRKFQQDALNTHNILRAEHCSPALVLDDVINARAQAYAEYLASRDSRLIHSTDRKGLYGENLYAVTRSSIITNPNADKVVRTWYTEVKYYDYNKPGYTRETGHFSQIVWKDTKRLGVGYAFARGGRKMYVAAQYGPPGNYGFAYRWNVLEPTCKELGEED